MDDGQRGDLNSARYVLAVLLANGAIVEADDNLKALREFLKLTIPKVDAAGGVQLAGRGGVQAVKENLRLDTAEIGKTWLTALKTVDAPADMELPGILATTLSAYEKLGENEWYQFNLKLIPKCTLYLDKVSKYGRTAEEIALLTSNNISFEKMITAPEGVTQMLSQAKIDVDTGIDGMNSEAKGTDKYVRPYEGLHPVFVAQYFDAREKKGK